MPRTVEGPMTRHLYLHIPFCQRRCSYCDFNTYANLEDRIDAYVDALCADMRRAKAQPDDWRRMPAPETTQGPQNSGDGLLRRHLRPTIFLGGGNHASAGQAQKGPTPAGA